ncbi:MAG: hypothetical protein AAGF24_00075 [Cyanobacteria bacterium P01_H01_bin.121]
MYASGSAITSPPGPGGAVDASGLVTAEQFQGLVDSLAAIALSGEGADLTTAVPLDKLPAAVQDALQVVTESQDDIQMRSLAADLTLSESDRPVQIITPAVSGLSVSLPTSLANDGRFKVINSAASLYDLTVAGETIAAGNMLVALFDSDSGSWYNQVAAFNPGTDIDLSGYVTREDFTTLQGSLSPIAFDASPSHLSDEVPLTKLPQSVQMAIALINESVDQVAYQTISSDLELTDADRPVQILSATVGGLTVTHSTPAADAVLKVVNNGDVSFTVGSNILQPGQMLVSLFDASTGNWLYQVNRFSVPDPLIDIGPGTIINQLIQWDGTHYRRTPQDGDRSLILGHGSQQVSGTDSLVAGIDCTSAHASVVQGYQVDGSESDYSCLHGFIGKGTGPNGVGFGINFEVGQEAAGIGIGIRSGKRAFAGGSSAWALQYADIALGRHSLADGGSANAQGHYAKALGQGSLAFGPNTLAEFLNGGVFGAGGSSRAESAIQLGAGENRTPRSLQFMSTPVANLRGLVAFNTAIAFPTDEAPTGTFQFSTTADALFWNVGGSVWKPLPLWDNPNQIPLRFLPPEIQAALQVINDPVEEIQHRILAGDLTLSPEAQPVQILQTSLSGFTITLPATLPEDGRRKIINSQGSSASFAVADGSNSYTVEPGDAAIAYFDATAGSWYTQIAKFSPIDLSGYATVDQVDSLSARLDTLSPPDMSLYARKGDLLSYATLDQLDDYAPSNTLTPLAISETAQVRYNQLPPDLRKLISPPIVEVVALSADPAWSFTSPPSPASADSRPGWTSRIGGEAQTGTLQIFKLRLGDTLKLHLAGGGLTGGDLKRLKLVRLSDDTTLLDRTLAEIWGVNSNGYQEVSIDTTALKGEACYLQLEDNDTGSGWSWLAVGTFDVVVEGAPDGTVYNLAEFAKHSELTDQLSGLIEQPLAKTFPLIPKAFDPIRIFRFYAAIAAGTTTLTLRKVPAGGDPAIDLAQLTDLVVNAAGPAINVVLTTPADIAVGDRLELEIKNASGDAADLEFNLHYGAS